MRTYVMVTAIAMLVIGILGFAFSDQVQFGPWYILAIDLILGVWGMVALFRKTR